MKKYPFTKQNGLRDCGPACVQMILKYYDGYMSLDKLSYLLCTNNKGTSLYNMIECLKNLGFDACGYRYDDLSKINCPCVVHIKRDIYNHYIVIYEINYRKKYVIIADSTKGIIKMSFNDFFSIWTGVTIDIKPVFKIVKEEEPSVFKFLLNIFKSNRFHLFLICLLSFIICLLSVISSFFLQIVLSSRLFISFSFVIVLFVKSLIIFFKNKIIIEMDFRIDKFLFTDTFRKIIYLPYAYSKNKTSGELISYFNDLFMIKKVFNYIQILFINVPLIIIISILLIIMCFKLYFLNLFILLFYLIFYFFFRKKFFFLSDDVLRNKALVNSYISECINGLKTINNLDIHEKVIDSFNIKYDRYNILNKKFEKMCNNQFLLRDFILNVLLLIILFYGFFNKSNFIAVYFLFTLLNTSFLELFEFNGDYASIIASLKRILELRSEVKSKIISSKNISATNVKKSFNNSIILKDINLFIRKGEKVFVTGESGSGKSTLFRIIKGYYDYDGICKIDDYDSLKYYFSKVLYVSSDEYLFTGRLIDTLSSVKYSDLNKKICEVDFDNDDLIYENGFNLSTGQRQRIALARALGDFDILIIDEGLECVDTNMERRILKKIFMYYTDKTIIYISHRLDNLDLFDRFIKMNFGRIILDEQKNI